MDHEAGQKINRRFTNAGEATSELFTSFGAWSSNLAAWSMQLAYAVIAANWAAHGNTTNILHNWAAKSSMAVAVGFLALHLLLTGWMTWRYGKRLDYADANKARWEKEFETSAKEPSPWPYTGFIEGLGTFIRLLRIWLPLAAGLLFILSLVVGRPGPICR